MLSRIYFAYSLAAVVVITLPSTRQELLTVGTALVALKTNNAIVIAADSRVSRLYGTGVVEKANDEACKLFERNGVVFGSAGVESGPSGFDPQSIAKKVMVRGRPVMDMAAEFQRAVTGPLQVELRNWKNDPRETAEGVPGLKFLFAGREQGVNVLVWANLAGVRDDNNLLTVKPLESGAWPRDAANVVLLGKTAAIMREKGRIGFRTDAEAVLLAKALIGLEADDPVDAQFVGGPVDVVAITPQGVRWPQRKTSCQGSGR